MDLKVHKKLKHLYEQLCCQVGNICVINCAVGTLADAKRGALASMDIVGRTFSVFTTMCATRAVMK